MEGSPKFTRKRIQILLQKHSHQPPLSNRYFYKILKDESLLTKCQNTSTQKINPPVKIKDNTIQRLSRSIQTLAHSKCKKNINQPSLKSYNSFCLPKINNKIVQASQTQLISSNLGRLNSYQILANYENLQLKQHRISRLTQKSSLVSEQQLQSQQQIKQRAPSRQIQQYSQYDKILMKQVPEYHKKRFRLKHKADWLHVA